MWRRAPFTASMPVPAYPSEDVESHAHSPRRRPKGVAADSSGYSGPIIQGIMATASSGNGSKHSIQTGVNPSQLNYNIPPGYEADPFGCSNTYTDWIGNTGVHMNDVHMTGQSSNMDLRKTRKMSTDVSMPDYSSSSQSGHMQFSGDETLCLPAFTAEEDHYFGSLKVPTNTPTANPQRICEPGMEFALPM